MPSDVSVELVAHATTAPRRRLPVGVGLAIGAFASAGLWALIGFSVKALLA